MTGLNSHIEYLLRQHDCVVIPGFGGFILHYQESTFVGMEQISAPSKQISFNAALIHSDGLLEHAVMSDVNCSFSEAAFIIQSEVKQLLTKLYAGEVVEMGLLGKFSLNEEGSIFFQANPLNIFDLNYYGFDSITLHPLQASVLETEIPKLDQSTSSSKDVMMIPVNLRILRHVGAVAILVIGLLLISYPVQRGDISANYASLISSSLLKHTIIPEDIDSINQSDLFYENVLEDSSMASSVQEDLINSENESLSSLDLNLSSQELEPQNEVAQSSETNFSNSSSQKIADNSNKSNSLTSGKSYYIVIGSFPDEKQALYRIEYLQSKGLYNVQYIEKDHKYRLYIHAFSDKKEANNYLEQFRNEYPEFQDAWLYAQRLS